MNNQDFNDIDYDLLEKVLDFITENTSTLPSAEIIEKVKLGLQDSFTGTIAEIFRRTNWNRVSTNYERPRICISCISLNCIHLINNTRGGIDLDESLCVEHETNWYINGICIGCILSELQTEKVSKENKVVELWDNTDLATYAYWKSIFELQQGNFN